MNTLNKLFGSILRFVGFVCLGVGVLFFLFAVSYYESEIYFSMYLLGWGAVMYVVDGRLNEFENPKRYWTVQILGFVLFAFTSSVLYSYKHPKTYLKIKDSSHEDAVIIYGIDGYPKLPMTILWQKNIEMPENRILITSSLKEELTSYFTINPESSYLTNTSISIPCISNLQVLEVDYFSRKRLEFPLIENLPSNRIADQIKLIQQQICEGKLKTIQKIDTKVHFY